MLIIRANTHRSLVLKGIVKQFRAGAVIVYPTDTAYALGVDATNARAVARIFALKGRARVKGLPLIVADLKTAKKFFFLSPNHLTLAARYWPGPLSLVLKAKKNIASAALEGGAAAVRVPDSSLARKLAKLVGRPLVATSANVSGQPTCYSIKAFLRQFKTISRPFPKKSKNSPGLSATLPFPKGGEKSFPLFVSPRLIRLGRKKEGEGGVLVLDAGALAKRKPSTIVAVEPKGSLKILRQGPIRPKLN